MERSVRKKDIEDWKIKKEGRGGTDTSAGEGQDS